jgi:hypothetical protein
MKLWKIKLWKMKKTSDEIMNLVEKNVGTPAILGRALTIPLHSKHNTLAPRE